MCIGFEKFLFMWYSFIHDNLLKTNNQLHSNLLQAIHLYSIPLQLQSFLWILLLSYQFVTKIWCVFFVKL